METFSKKILNYAMSNNYIQSEQYDEYLYMLTIFLNILVHDITMLCIGFAMGMIWECIVFWTVYKVLRKYCGGYHFSTSFKCYLSSCALCIITLCIIKYAKLPVVLTSGGAVVCCVILFFISPVAAVNKPLDEAENIMYGKIARILTFVFLIIYATVILLKFYMVAKVIALGIISVTLFAVIGKIPHKS